MNKNNDFLVRLLPVLPTVYIVAGPTSLFGTPVCGTGFLAAVKYLLRCTGPGYMGHLAMWDTWLCGTVGMGRSVFIHLSGFDCIR